MQAAYFRNLLESKYVVVVAADLAQHWSSCLDNLQIRFWTIGANPSRRVLGICQRLATSGLLMTF